MLDLINRYCHGYVALPVIHALREKGVFEAIQAKQTYPIESIIKDFQGNSGHLNVAFRLLESLKILQGSPNVTPGERFSWIAAIPASTLSLIDFPFPTYFSAQFCQSPQASGLTNEVINWLELAQQNWHCDDPMLADFLDGLLLLPLLLTLKTHLNKSATEQLPRLIQSLDCQAPLTALFLQRGWLQNVTDGSRSEPAILQLSAAGQHLIERIMIGGTMYSYQPMLSGMHELIFGTVSKVFHRDEDGHEVHLDRLLNVQASGFQHERYFDDSREIILEIFNREPVSQQPAYIADMGCGDGTFLKRIYELIAKQTLRGKNLKRYPLTLIGADYNQKALAATDENLGQIPHKTIHADIGDPVKFLSDLADNGVHDKDKILHIRSFLDHDRPFIAPQNSRQLEQRHAGRKHSVYVDKQGLAIVAVQAYQSLVEHLQRWSIILGESGAIMLEVHSLAPKVIAENIDQCENLHFDAYHAFSGQMLVDADEFLFAAAEAGLFPKLDYACHYPKTFSFSRISLNWFEKRDYALRPAFLSDLGSLQELDYHCWPEHLRAGSERIETRLHNYPAGQYVVHQNDKIIGALYTQRIHDEKQLEQIDFENIPRLHQDDGSIVQILGFNIAPQLQHLGLGDQILDFMLYSLSLSGETQKIVGISRCKNYAQYQHCMNMEEYVHSCRESGEWDTVLNFHVHHGAEIVKPIADYWPADIDNQGYGILIRYDLQDSEPAALKTESENLDIEAIFELVETAILTILGRKRKTQYRADRALMEMGLDSLDLLELRGLLNRYLGTHLEPMFFFSYGTAEAIVCYFQQQQDKSHNGEQSYAESEASASYQVADFAADSYLSEKKTQSSDGLDIAIVGMSCRFPGGVDSPEALWQLLMSGKDSIERIPAKRWDIDRFNNPRYTAEHPINPYGGFIHGVDQFDAEFFGLSPREARLIDPQHRLLLETSWEAFERAAINPEQHPQTGIFVGVYAHDYELLATQRNLDQNLDVYHAVGNSASMAAGRLAYFYGFHGPALAIDTACSSSLVAVKQACDSLKRGECEVAIAAGVNLMLSPELNVTFSKSGMLAADGHCKTFDAAADGYVRSEGCGVVLLKPLKNALADRDSILAVVKAAAVNQDGASNGITAPNGLAQQALMRNALKQARLKPQQISLLEAHGTGTPLGDPVEVEAVGQVYGEQRDADNPLIISSIKTNIGHTESAAGVAGLIKLCLAMQHQSIPPHLHFKQPNPRLNLQSIPAIIPQQEMSWPEPIQHDGQNKNQEGNHRRLAAISSFGFSGTNAHLILEQGPELLNEPLKKVKTPSVLTLSAASSQALSETLGAYRNYFASENLPSLLDICASAAMGRKHFKYRLAFSADNCQQMQQRLDDYAQQLDGHLTSECPGSNVLEDCIHRHPQENTGQVFLFTGQGSQYQGMGKELYYHQACFRETIDRCDELFKPYLNLSLKEILFSSSADEQHLSQTHITQPALFSIEYALARQWQAWGISPDVMIGHSIGEYAAACIAGVFDLETAVKLVAWRGQLMQAQKSDGKMAAVNCDEQTLKQLLSLENSYAITNSDLVIAGYNAPESLVISGSANAVDAAIETLRGQQIKLIPLNVSHAFHSPLMQGMVNQFNKILSDSSLNPPRIKIISTLTGRVITNEMARPDYWTQQIIKPVNYHAAVQTLAALDISIKSIMEIGPRNILLNLTRQIMTHASLPKQQFVTIDELIWVNPLEPGISDNLRMADNLAKMYRNGADIQWEDYFSHLPFNKVILPTYPFQRQSYWLDAIYSPTEKSNSDVASRRTVGIAGEAEIHPLLGAELKTPLANIKVQFQQQLSLLDESWLTGHQIQNRLLMPLAAYISMALFIAKQLSEEPALTTQPQSKNILAIADVVVGKACILDSEVTILHSYAQNDEISIYSLAEADNHSEKNTDWQQHFQARWQHVKTAAGGPNTDLEALKHSLKQNTVADFYRQCHTAGYQFSDAFNSIKALYQGPEQALIQAKYQHSSLHYGLHPVLIDAAIQSALILLPGINTLSSGHDEQALAKTCYLPFSAEHIELKQCDEQVIWSHAEKKSQNRHGMTIDLHLYNVNGEVLGGILGLLFKPIPVKSESDFLTQSNLAKLLYQPVWEAQALTETLEAFHFDPLWLDQEQAFKSIQGSAGALNQLAIAYFCQALHRLGLEDGQQYQHLHELLESLSIVATYKQFVARMIQVLNLEYHEQSSIRLVQRSESILKIINIRALGDPEDIFQRLNADFPSLSTELQLLARCARRFDEILRGDCDPLGLIFSDSELTARFYRQAPSFCALNQTLAKAIAAMAVGRSRPVRILEIGAGTGSATSFIVPELGNTEYHYTYTDVSEYFLQQGKINFGENGNIHYRLLDIASEPTKQGFPQQAFDIIIAANVLHATGNLVQTLIHCKQLLATNGRLVLLEGIQETAWIDSIFGLTEGWWAFNDELRSNYPLLDLQHWHQAIENMGWKAVSLALEHPDAPFKQAVLVATNTDISAAGMESSSSVAELTQELQADSQTWLIFDEQKGYAREFAVLLRQQGIQVIRVTAKQDAENSSDADSIWHRSYQIDLDNVDQHRECLEKIATDPEWSLMVNFWPWAACDIEYMSANEHSIVPEKVQEQSDQIANLARLSQDMLHLNQALMAKERFHDKIFHLTPQAHTLDSELGSQPQAAILWGIHKVAALEYPQLMQTMIDWDLQYFDPKQLFQEICRNENEAQVAYRNGQRHVARIAALKSAQEIEQPARYWSVREKGTIDALSLHSDNEPSKNAQLLAHNQVTIQVQYSGLNFIDVMDVLDLLPFQRQGLGMECAGVVTQCGAGVTRFQPGQAVIALAEGALADFVNVDARLVAELPESLSVLQAASLPVNYLTAYYALFEVADLQAGQHILIHAATGGTGMAAVRLALSRGAQVYASASREKWPVLEQMGVTRIVNSRDLSFAEQMQGFIQEQGLPGIDVVFNSLSGDFIPAGISLLKANGCFLEIGKRDLLTPEQLQRDYGQINYQAIDLRKISQQQPWLIEKLFKQVLEQIQHAALPLAPIKRFTWEQVPDAFRYMQQAKHIGKIVLENRRQLTPQQIIRADAAYLITGGLKGVGLDTALWLAENGAGKLFLVGRSEPKSEQLQIIDEIKAFGTQVEILIADVTDTTAMQVLFQNIKTSTPRLKGIIQSVGVLDDGIILQQNWDRFAKVLMPKVAGAWNLHQLSGDFSLDFFILYSSVVSVLGNAGQASHAAANAFLDALVHYRHSQGLVGQCVNWCGWSEIGSAAERDVSDKIRPGLGNINPCQGRQILAEILQGEKTQVAVMPMDWSKFLRNAPFASYYSYFAQKTTSVQEPTHAEQQKIISTTDQELLREQLQGLNASEQKRRLGHFITSQLAQVLGMESADLVSKSKHNQAGFFDLGLDSLTSVEFKNRLNQGLDLKISSAAIFDYPTLEQMSDYLLDSLKQQLTDGDEITTIAEQDKVETNAAPELPELDQISDEQAAALLAKELAKELG